MSPDPDQGQEELAAQQVEDPGALAHAGAPKPPRGRLLAPAWALSGLAVLAMLAATAWAWGQVPDSARIPIHWGWNGQPNGYAGRGPALLMAPILAAAMSLLLGMLSLADPRLAASPPTLRAYRGVWLGLISLLALIHACMLGLAFGYPVPMLQALMAGLGALLAYTGLALRQVEPNSLIGIRTRATLRDPAAWARVHKKASLPFTILGCLLFLSALLGLPAPLLSAILVAGLAAVTVAMLVLAR